MRGREIIDLAVALGGEEERREVLLPLCRAAEEELRARLREGLCPKDCGAAFPVAAAWIALDGLEAVGGVESFSAGDLTIRQAGRSREGELRRKAERLMAPYLKETDFAFQGV